MKPSEVKVIHNEYSNKLDHSEGGETHKISKNKNNNNNLLIFEGFDENSRDVIQIQTSSDLENRVKQSQVKILFI